MKSDTDLRTNIVCWICNSCNTIFTESNIDEYWAENSESKSDPTGNQGAERCQSCGQSLSRGYLTDPWEDGNNAEAYVTCPHCGYKNTLYGYGGD
jgi:DNA-directed RNA polymerase subunit RPC12/RpoP